MKNQSVDVHNTHTYQEIMSQPSIWAGVIVHVFKKKKENNPFLERRHG